MRAAAAIIAAAAIAQGCSPGGNDRDAIFLASLEEFGKSFREPRLPVCAILSERQPVASRGWAFVQGPAPAGFEDVADWAPVAGPLSADSLGSRLPERWFIQEAAAEPCIQFTRPAVGDGRAVVTAAFAEAGEALFGTWNFWLRRDGDRWRVVTTTKGHQDV